MPPIWGGHFVNYWRPQGNFRGLFFVVTITANNARGPEIVEAHLVSSKPANRPIWLSLLTACVNGAGSRYTLAGYFMGLSSCCVGCCEYIVTDFWVRYNIFVVSWVTPFSWFGVMTLALLSLPKSYKPQHSSCNSLCKKCLTQLIFCM